MSRSPPRGDGDEGTEDAEDIEGILQGIMGIQGIRIEDVSNDREGEMYEAQWGIDFGNEGEMYDGQLGIDFENEGEMFDGQSGIDFANEVEGLYYEPELYYEHEEGGNELENDDGQWEEETTQGRGTIPFQSDVENVEFPVSNVQLPVSLVAGRSEVTRPKVHTKKYVSCMSVYVVGEELGDDGSPSAADTVVDTMVWETVPEEVVEAVLLRLPAAAQARCRAVCKAWLAILASSQFIRRSFLQSVSQVTPPLCAVSYCPQREYEPPMENESQKSPLFKFLNVDLSFLPEVFHSNLSQLHNCSPSGFLCISRYFVAEGMHFCVLNPVNQSFKVLPVLQKLWGFDVVLLMGTVTAAEIIPSFKVYVSGVEDSMALFKGVAIYSSITDEWKGFLGGPDVYRTPAVACNGEVYTTVDSTPPQLVRLSTEAGPRYLWHLELPGFKNCRHWENDKCRHWEEEFSLVGYRGRLLCFCHGIWMLDDARQVWVEIAGRCPLDILLPYLPCNPGTERLPETEPLTSGSMQVAGDLLVFLPRFYSHRHVAYDMLRRVWRRVPEILALPRADVFQAMPNLRL